MLVEVECGRVLRLLNVDNNDKGGSHVNNEKYKFIMLRKHALKGRLNDMT